MRTTHCRAARARAAVLRIVATAIACVFLADAAQAQFIPYYGKNKVRYDDFAWRVYRSPHFRIYYYPEFEQHLGRIASYAESAYQHISSSLKHALGEPIPLVLYETHSEFEQTSLFPSFVPEGVAAFAEPSRNRMVLPIDEAPDKLYGLIVHELTHVFAYDLIPRGFMQGGVPLWVDEGLADYLRGIWEPLDLMSIRDLALADEIPPISQVGDGGFDNPRMVYNLGHAVFEFIEARYGKEGVRQFLYTLRKNLVGGTVKDLFHQAFRITPREFDNDFETWLKERFKDFRDKEPASSYGRELTPDPRQTRYSQVFAFSPSPSGELLAALTVNQNDGEADLVLLSSVDGSILRNLTGGFTGRYESISFNDSFIAGRTIDFGPGGDKVAFVARTGKGRSLFLVSVSTGQIVRQVEVDLDLAQAPSLLPDGRSALLAGLRMGVSDIYRIDLETGALENLTRDAFRDSDPRVSPDGGLVVYVRRVSGHDKLFAFRLDDPDHKIQLTFGTHDDVTPSFSPDGERVFFSSSASGDIYNLRSLSLVTGVEATYTDTAGGNCAPELLAGREGDRLAFIGYSKGQFRLHAVELREPLAEVDATPRAGDVDVVDFQPDVHHEIMPENKRRKRVFENFYMDGRPPINVGVTSGGDFFGGTQLAFSDVLGDKNLILSIFAEREFRTYQAQYVDVQRRLQWGLTAFDTTLWGYADPYGTYGSTYSRDNAIASQRLTGGTIFAVFPLDKLRRIEASFGAYRESSSYVNPDVQRYLEQESQGLPYTPARVQQSGTVAPLGVTFIQETSRFHIFGPLSGNTVALGATVAPGIGSALQRVTLQGDARKYVRLGSTVVLALRARGFYSSGRSPDYTFFGGNMELRGYDYHSFAGNEVFFTNAELRFPVIDVMKTPLGLLGPVRGTLFTGLGGARWKNQRFRFWESGPGYSYINDSVFGEATNERRLVDARASYGVGLQVFLLGYPMHFDWSKYTDLAVSSDRWSFSFWIGYDF